MRMLALTVLSAALIPAPAIAGTNVPADLVHKAQYTAQTDHRAETDLIDTAAHNGAFTTLLSAAEAAGLSDELKEDGPFTLFAPTDAAFAKLPAGTVERLLDPENRDELARLLKMHVVAGERLTTADLAGEQMTAETLNGPLAIDASDPISGVRVNDASVTLSDISASNGVIHAIDTVLLPARSGL